MAVEEERDACQRVTRKGVTVNNELNELDVTQK